MPGGKDVLVRSTEGMNRDEASTYKSHETRRQRGRPKGSLNKSKGLIPTESADVVLAKLKPVLSSERYEYTKGVMKNGDPIQIEKELDVLILLLSQQVIPAMLAETEGEQLPAGVEDPNPSAIKMPEFRKDVTERIKVLKDFMDMKSRNERAKADGANDTSNPLKAIFASRNLTGGRLRIAIEHVGGDMGGSPDEPERPADSAGSVPVALSERPIILPGSGESTTNRDFNDDRVGDRTRSVHEA